MDCFALLAMTGYGFGAGAVAGAISGSAFLAFSATARSVATWQSRGGRAGVAAATAAYAMDCFALLAMTGYGFGAGAVAGAVSAQTFWLPPSLRGAWRRGSPAGPCRRCGGDRGVRDGLLRFARNDGLRVRSRGSRWGCFRLRLSGFLRHCEERSDVAVQRGPCQPCGGNCGVRDGLLRFARNDGLRVRSRGSRWGCFRLRLSDFLRHCEERSDVAVQRGPCRRCGGDCGVRDGLLRFARNDGLRLRSRGGRWGCFRLRLSEFPRHCEERSDVAVQGGGAGLAAATAAYAMDCFASLAMTGYGFGAGAVAGVVSGASVAFAVNAERRLRPMFRHRAP